VKYLTLLLLGACAVDLPTPAPSSNRRGTAFIADVDPAAKKFDISVRGGSIALEPAVVDQDGVPFEGQAETIELYTESAVIDVDGSLCGYASSFCTVVNVANFYSGPLGFVIAEINAISPAAQHEGLNSDPPSFNLSDQLGLWDYGSIATGSLGQKTWVFGDDGTAYRIAGTIWADLPLPPAPSFGYTGGAIAFAYDDIASSGAAAGVGDDGISAAINIGFGFDFFGTTLSALRIAANGFLVMDPGQTSTGCCSGQSLPDPVAPNGVIAGYWEDLGAGNVRYATLGNMPNRRFVVDWSSVAHFGGGPAVSFQIVLFEGSGDVEIRHLSAPSDGGEHAVGIERADGFDGLSLAFGDVSFGPSAFRIVHP